MSASLVLEWPQCTPPLQWVGSRTCCSASGWCCRLCASYFAARCIGSAGGGGWAVNGGVARGVRGWTHTAHIYASILCRSFARQQYFDSQGLFLSLLLTLPIILNCSVMVVRHCTLHMHMQHPFTPSLLPLPLPLRTPLPTCSCMCRSAGFTRCGVCWWGWPRSRRRGPSCRSAERGIEFVSRVDYFIDPAPCVPARTKPLSPQGGACVYINGVFGGRAQV